mgnify:CR=1 FL=1
MSNEKTGGPAYPVTKNNGFGYEYTVAGNLTVLDHFAGLAMQGHWASQTEESCSLDWMRANPELEEGQLRIVAKLAYAQATAMIAERTRLMNEKP